MSFVVDASVAVKWFVLDEPLRAAARAFLVGFGDRLEAPDLLLVETANVAWKKHRNGELDIYQATEIVREVDGCIAILHRSTDLVERALDIAIAYSHPIYDCLYLACTEVAVRPLVTADRRLIEKVSGTPFEASVRHLAEVVDVLE
jgi:predicted nucleic acid-binding protein